MFDIPESHSLNDLLGRNIVIYTLIQKLKTNRLKKYIVYVTVTFNSPIITQKILKFFFATLPPFFPKTILPLSPKEEAKLVAPQINDFKQFCMHYTL